MAYNDKTKQYVYEYKAKNIKRVPLDMPVTEYELLKQAASAAGMPVNSFIKQAIRAAIVQASPAAAADPVQASAGAGLGSPGGDALTGGGGQVTPASTPKE